VELDLHLTAADYENASRLGDDLKYVLIVSKVNLQLANEEKITVMSSKQQKCPRCWHYRDDIGHDVAHPELCGRCVSNLFGSGEHRTHA